MRISNEITQSVLGHFCNGKQQYSHKKIKKRVQYIMDGNTLAACFTKPWYWLSEHQHPATFQSQGLIWSINTFYVFSEICSVTRAKPYLNTRIFCPVLHFPQHSPSFFIRAVHDHDTFPFKSPHQVHPYLGLVWVGRHCTQEGCVHILQGRWT